VIRRLAQVARYFPVIIGWLVLFAALAYAGGVRLLVLLVAIASATYAIACAESAALTSLAIAAHLVGFAWVLLGGGWSAGWLITYGVVMCHAVAYLFDVQRGHADTSRPLHAALYLIQLPVLIAGPLSRYRDFSTQLSRSAMSLGAFAYGMRRIITGLIKALLVGGVLAETVNAIYAAPIPRLTAAAAWLGAICFSLQIYLQFSGYCDVGIGVGRMIGLRYSENFRRPYTADSIREFWRRWNVTLITWLRDYLFLPIAGQDAPTPRLFLNIVAGFCLVALWHGGRTTFLVWGVYCGSWLALEAVGFRARVERLPRLVRHLYVLLVVVVGWVILRAPDLATAGQLLSAMAGMNSAPVMAMARFTSLALWSALVVGIFAAGPLVPSISRWRVSIDAATTSLLMMIAATGVFLWRGPSLAIRSIWPKSANS
jgi:alginate O-acetyltransferase complex protein AlgI